MVVAEAGVQPVVIQLAAVTKNPETVDLLS